MRLHQLILLGLVAFSNPSFAQEVFKLSEGWLAKEALKASFQVKGIDASVLAKEVEFLDFDKNFDMSLISSATHMQTNKNIDWQPGLTLSPATEVSAGVKKNFVSGLSFKAEAYLQKQTMDSPMPEKQDYHALGGRVEAFLDLGANLGGEQFKTNQFRLNADLSVARVEAGLNKNLLKKNMRSVYWQLVANRKAKAWRLEILNYARRQLKLIEDQASAFVSDEEDVKTFQALVIGQEAEIISLENQYAVISQNLKSAFPVLVGKNLVVDLKQADAKRKTVLYCINTIKDIPHETVIETSSYKKLLIANEYNFQSTNALSNLDSRADFKVFAKYDSLGQSSKDFDEALSNNSVDRKNTTTIGLQFSMPLTSGLETAISRKRKFLKTAHNAKQEQIIGTLKGQREASLRQIKLLNDSITLSKKLTKTTEEKVVLARKKYEQARLPLALLIQDEMSLLDSKLRRVQLQLQIVITLLDYLKKFDQTPCEFNSI